MAYPSHRLLAYQAPAVRAKAAYSRAGSSKVTPPLAGPLGASARLAPRSQG